MYSISSDSISPLSPFSVFEQIGFGFDGGGNTEIKLALSAVSDNGIAADKNARPAMMIHPLFPKERIPEQRSAQIVYALLAAEGRFNCCNINSKLNYRFLTLRKVFQYQQFRAPVAGRSAGSRYVNTKQCCSVIRIATAHRLHLHATIKFYLLPLVST